MSALKRLIREIHRRSLWQVMAIYLVGAWIAYEVIQSLTEGLDLPAWLPALAVVLFIIGLPIVVATAFVQEGPAAASRADPTLIPGAEGEAERAQVTDSGLRRFLTWRNAILGGVLAFALWGVVAAAWLLMGESGDTAATESLASGAGPVSRRVAVFPFEVRGGDEFAYLGEGMVDLLSTRLDGAGEIRSVDARALLGTVKRQDLRTPTPARAREVARGFDAGLFVLGNILEVQGRLSIKASLYEAARQAEALADATAEGSAERFFEIVDSLAVQLLSGVSGGPERRLTRTAALTTASLPALKAYLEGEEAFRSGHFDTAVQAFRRATRADSTFALAYYRLSLALEWQSSNFVLAQRAAEKAARHSERLSDHDQLLLQGLLAHRRGAAAEAERIYRTVVADYPEDVEAWFQLGEVLFHSGPLHGSSVRESRPAWEQVLASDPEHLEAMIHLARIAAREGRHAELDSLVERIVLFSPENDRALPMLALRAAALADSAALERVIADLRGSTDNARVLAVTELVNFLVDPDAARRVTRVMIEDSNSPEMRALAHAWLACLEVARGRWTAAQSELAAVYSLDRAKALGYRAFLALLPWQPVPDDELYSLRSELLEWDASSVPASTSASVPVSAHDGLHPHLRLYLLGLLSARLGDGGAALRHSDRLEGLEGPIYGGSVVEDLTRAVRAHAAVGAGRWEEAVNILARLEMDVWYIRALWSPFLSQPQARYLRARVLAETGSLDQAVHAYRSFAEPYAPSLIVYLAPSLYHRARLHERMGERDEAVRHYTRFLELWQAPDPALGPMVEEARRRLSELEVQAP